MRLVDRVRLEIAGLPDEIICLVADEVARQIDAMPGDTWAESPPAELYGCVAPPFERFFVEAETVVDLSELPGRRARGRQLVQRGALVEVEQGDSKQRWRWRYALTPFAWYQPVADAVVTGLHTVNGRIFLHLDEAGQVLDDMERIKTAVFDNSRLTAERMRSYVSFVPFILKAVSLLHQNTAVERVDPMAVMSRQQRRQHERKHKQALSSYYVLKVKPGVVPVRFEDVGQPAPGPGRREHVVRGHFRYYSPERPLFGRYSGAVWVGEHQRGESGLGRIRKDYLIDSDESRGKKGSSPK